MVKSAATLTTSGRHWSVAAASPCLQAARALPSRARWQPRGGRWASGAVARRTGCACKSSLNTRPSLEFELILQLVRALLPHCRARDHRTVLPLELVELAPQRGHLGAPRLVLRRPSDALRAQRRHLLAAAAHLAHGIMRFLARCIGEIHRAAYTVHYIVLMHCISSPP